MYNWTTLSGHTTDRSWTNEALSGTSLQWDFPVFILISSNVFHFHNLKVKNLLRIACNLITI
jgi:hypothetical protein